MEKKDNPLYELIASNIYARYSGILSLSDISLFLTDIDGKILVELIPAPDFCTHVCRMRKDQVCDDYKNQVNEKNDCRFVCQYGLENISLPIKMNGETLGYVAGMQVFSKDTEYQKYMINTNALKEEKNLELEYIAKAIAALKTVDSNKLKIHEQLCSHIANNLSIDLSESVNHLNPDLERLSIEKEILEKKIIDLEVKNMSLVVNPHFLFNTLNCIARIAYFEQSHTTEELIYCLSDLLRYNLKQGDQLHTIASEIDNIEKYLYIQKARFKNRLEYSIDVPETIRSYRIPNMVIQPIVENALIHGITPKRDGGKISIQAIFSESEIIISVEDNGVGFPKELLDNQFQVESKSGLGLCTTDKRLKQYYGGCYGLEIVKSNYSGSTVAIRMPTKPTVRC